jgi:ADP-heptose:LPS heptosyltransferase
MNDQAATICDPRPPKSILVVPGSKAFGDVLEAFPVFDLVRELWPQARLAVGCQTRAQELTMEMYPVALPRVPIARGSVRRAGVALRAFKANLRTLRGFDVVLFLYKGKACWPMVLAARLTGARVFHGHDYRYRNERRNPYSDFPGRVFNQIFAADRLGLPLSHLREPRLVLPAADRQFAEELFRSRGLGRRPTVMMNSMASVVLPSWGIARYAQTANALVESGADVIINAGRKAQLDECRSVADRLRKEVVLVETPSPPMLAAVMARCDLVIGEASGQTWLATALGLPVIVLLGPGERNYHGQGRVGPAWWPRDPRQQLISKIDWCQMNMGRRCQCRYADGRSAGLVKALKLVGAWKPVKRWMPSLGRTHGPGEVRAVPCLDAIHADEVIDLARQRLGLGPRSARPGVTGEPAWTRAV